MKRAKAVLALACLAMVCSGCGRGEPAEPDRVFDPPTREFLDGINADTLGKLVVQYRGRLAPLATVASEQISQICGRQRLEGIDPPPAYLEIYLNAGRYADRPMIHVRSRNMRAFIRKHLSGRWLETFDRTNRLAPASLWNDNARHALVQAGRASPDDMTRCLVVPSLRSAWSQLAGRREFDLLLARLDVRYGAFLGTGVLRIIPGEAGYWHAADELLSEATPADTHEERRLLVDLRDAWLLRDVAKANELIATIADLSKDLPDRPSQTAVSLELLYNRAYKGHLVWIGFAIATVVLIVAVASGLPWVRRVGMGVMILSTLGLLAGFVMRWIISARPWYLPPMMSQYEALLASALMGAILIVVIELFWPRNYPAVAACFYAAVVLLSLQFSSILFPGALDSSLRAMKGILSSRIMAVHVAVIVIGHALAGMTLVTSAIYLGILTVRGIEGPGAVSSRPDLTGGVPATVAATVDRCNLVIAQLACWMIVMGTILGAVWGSFAWGRWWGWDPKETWSLVTALFYLVVIHVRFCTPARYRGLVTAIGCLVGCGAMLFNWFGVNYILRGLHSYA